MVFMWEISSRTRVRLPSFRCAARRASSGVMPRAMLSSVSIARWASSSRARSSSHRFRKKKRFRLITHAIFFAAFARFAFSVSRGTQDPIHRAHDFVPPVRLLGELLLARRRQPVVPRLAVVLGRAPERGNPLAILEPVQRRIQRSVLHRE